MDNMTKRYMLKQLTIDDDKDIYNMLKEIPLDENMFHNAVSNQSFSEFKMWLLKQDMISKGIGLEHWMVPQTTYWLFIDDIPVGVGKLRHYLNDQLRIIGGHIGYAVIPKERKKGYGSVLLSLLLDEAKKIGIDKAMITVLNENTASLMVAKNCNGNVMKVLNGRHYIIFDTTISINNN
jgi:predicted acetyltransferase